MSRRMSTLNKAVCAKPDMYDGLRGVSGVQVSGALTTFQRYWKPHAGWFRQQAGGDETKQQ